MVLAAALYLFITKPVYEAKATIEIGKIEGQTIESAASLTAKLKTKYHVGDKNIKKEFPYIDSITAPRKLNNLIELKVLGLNNKDAAAYLDRVVADIITLHQPVLKNYIEKRKEYLSTLSSTIESLEKQLSTIERQINTQKTLLRSQAKSGLVKDAFLISDILSKNIMQVSALQEIISNKREEFSKVQTDLSPFKLKETKQIGKTLTYDHPVKPKKALVLALSLITGVILGVFMAFIVEFIGKKDEE